MKFSEARQSHLAHRILAVLEDEGLAKVDRRPHVLRTIKRLMASSHDRDASIDAVVRRKIDSLSRRVPPGSREWSVLYQQYFDQELRKQKS